ncbi:MAG TPA: type II toxin-antitoxin system RatA family toxin [Afifellaceae bacterium]|nr:type II toxin-antitoxin system RatA family toxin [Afifellaceae bacterium]
MPHFEARKRVQHSPEAMFDLVADVERYPEFLPFCESLVVKARDRDGTREVMIADMTIGYKLVRETITSRVVLDRDNMDIRADNVSGPFRQMQNTWHFAPLDMGGCEVRFSIAYEFKSRALAILVGGLFDKVFSRFADAFEARADDILSPAEARNEKK